MALDVHECDTFGSVCQMNQKNNNENKESARAGVINQIDHFLYALAVVWNKIMAQKYVSSSLFMPLLRHRHFNKELISSFFSFRFFLFENFRFQMASKQEHCR